MRILFIAFAMTMLGWLGTAHAQDDDNELAEKLLIGFVEAVRQGPETLATMLAPEFQLIRGNGTAFTREDYLQTGIKQLSIGAEYSHEDIVATWDSNHLVARYTLIIDETVNDQRIERKAPRLTVFRKIDESWKVAAHAVFARPE